MACSPSLYSATPGQKCLPKNLFPAVEFLIMNYFLEIGILKVILIVKDRFCFFKQSNEKNESLPFCHDNLAILYDPSA